MRSAKNLFALALMFFVFAVALSLIIWSDVSLAAKIALFALGFGSGITFGGWLSRRRE